MEPLSVKDESIDTKKGKKRHLSKSYQQQEID